MIALLVDLVDFVCFQVKIFDEYFVVGLWWISLTYDAHALRTPYLPFARRLGSPKSPTVIIGNNEQLDTKPNAAYVAFLQARWRVELPGYLQLSAPWVR